MISILLRSIIKDLSSVTAQLIDLTKNAVHFRWKDKQQNTFKASETSKLRLCSAPVLDTPQDCDQYVLDVDASDFGLGVVLQHFKIDIFEWSYMRVVR